MLINTDVPSLLQTDDAKPFAFRSFVPTLVSSMETLMASKRGCASWSDNIDPQSDAPCYAITFSDSGNVGDQRDAAWAAIRQFREENGIRSDSPVAHFGPFCGQWFIIGQA